jgi:hypothetical protein
MQADLLSLPASPKNVCLFVLGVAFQRHLTELEHQQEVLALLTDVLMYTYATESVELRSAGPLLSTVFTDHAMTRIEEAARTILAACSEGDALRMNLSILRRLTKRDLPNTIDARRRIAARLLEAERYVLV